MNQRLSDYITTLRASLLGRPSAAGLPSPETDMTVFPAHCRRYPIATKNEIRHEQILRHSQKTRGAATTSTWTLSNHILKNLVINGIGYQRNSDGGKGWHGMAFTRYLGFCWPFRQTGYDLRVILHVSMKIWFCGHSESLHESQCRQLSVLEQCLEIGDAGT